MSDHHLTDKPFARLDLPEVLLKGVRDAGFEFCTPIQAQALPLALAGLDVAGQAQTGTGKTAAFLLAAFHYLIKHPLGDRRPNQPRAVILAPTRELAVQIHKDALLLGGHTGFRMGVVYGGTGYEAQRQLLEEGVEILIGTPGRLIDYYKQHVFSLKSVQVMVLDEADRMFDLGFIRDVRFLLRRMPPPTTRLNMLFSATLSYRVTELAYEHMNNPAFIQIEPDKRTVDTVRQLLYHTAMDEKIPLLVHLLKEGDPRRSLIFVNTRDMAEQLAAWLKTNGLRAAVLSGDVPQRIRLWLLADFTEGRLPVLVATDVAARGLHIPDVSHVFNFDLPHNAEDYVHRIGRTARVGASGDAISFACEKFTFSLPDIEQYIGYKIPVARIVPEMLPRLQPPIRQERGQRDGERQRRRGRGARDKRQGAPAQRPKAHGRVRSATEKSKAADANKPNKPAKPPLRHRRGEKPVIG